MINLEASPKIKNEQIASKQDEICSLTKELRSHYFLGKYFVDPDKTFLNLLEKIIKFFEKDDLPHEIKENEYLYNSFKAKYQEAVQLIETLAEEKEKLSKALVYSQKHPNWYIEKRTFDEENLLSISMNDSPYSTKSNNNNDHKENVSDFDQDYANLQTVPLADYERLKEEYIMTSHLKKTLEIENFDLNEIKSQFQVLKEDHERLKDVSSHQAEHITRLESEAKCYLKQMEKQMKDRDELVETITALRQNLNLSEIEKSEIKIKNAHHLSKFKNMEAEITKLTKKNHVLANNVKDLLAKVQNEADMKRALQQNYDVKVEELENKIVALENEKKKITKDSMTTFVESTAKKMNSISLCYNANHNKIEIKYDNEIIGEVNNNESNAYTNTEKLKVVPNSHIKSPFNLKKEATLCRFRQLTAYDKLLQQTNSNQKQASPKKNVTLSKLFSNQNFSISSRKSFESNSFIEDKENKNSLNLNMITLNSIGQKTKPNYNSNVIIEEKDVTCFNNEVNISNCILNANLSKEALTFTNKKPTKKKEEQPYAITKQEGLNMITENSPMKQSMKLNVENFGIELITKEKKVKTHVCIPITEENSDNTMDNYEAYYKSEMVIDSNGKDNVKVISIRSEKRESDEVVEKKKGICFSCCIF